ncbi:MAG: bifunctional 3-deoxy-7-phosphoheptulonate synthase/chorismate mutase type II [Muribaculaceae bacterium]|nr:bifunctional 3-deoxy-7-phosphoheptulonate synthase/chorismate mutase type II [Muribaculaceae bacterium]
MEEIKPVLSADIIAEDNPIYIAGPCSVENEEILLTTAHQLAKGGIRVFRGGLWKPRTKPGGFEGVGETGLPWMLEVKKETGMSLATEVATPAHLEAALDGGIDLFWIGARTSANPFAVQELADFIASRNLDLPIFVKNPVNQDLELWIGALERFYNAGIRRLGAIHRGFSVYGPHLLRNMPEWHIPIELRRRFPTMTILSDPSHIGGKREFVKPLGQQALDMGFDGLIIESHCNPSDALSDREQQLTPAELIQIIEEFVYRSANQDTKRLEELRDEIDRCDNELLDILARRMAVCREIGEYKKEHNMPVVQIGRHDEIMQSRIGMAEKIGLSPKAVGKILSTIHAESVRQQIELMNSSKTMK